MKWDFELLILKYCAYRFRLLDVGQRKRFLDYFYSLDGSLTEAEEQRSLEKSSRKNAPNNYGPRRIFSRRKST